MCEDLYEGVLKLYVFPRCQLDKNSNFVDSHSQLVLKIKHIFFETKGKVHRFQLEVVLDVIIENLLEQVFGVIGKLFAKHDKSAPTNFSLVIMMNQNLQALRIFFQQFLNHQLVL